MWVDGGVGEGKEGGGEEIGWGGGVGVLELGRRFLRDSRRVRSVERRGMPCGRSVVELGWWMCRSGSRILVNLVKSVLGTRAQPL